MRKINVRDFKFPLEFSENVKIFIDKILQIDPAKRPSTKELLRNPLFEAVSIGNRKTLKNTYS